MEYVVGLLIGTVLGLTGAGGSVFAVPLLVYLVHLSPQDAIGVSLGAVCVSALFGVFTRLRSGQIQWLPAIVYSFIGGVASPVGIYLNKHIDPGVLMISFSVLVVFVAARLWWQATNAPVEAGVVRSALSSHPDDNAAICRVNHNRPFRVGLPCVFGISFGALTTGALSGIFGVGGGFIIVPALIFLTGIRIQQAVATSLVVISCISMTGLIGYLLSGSSLDLTLLSRVSFGGVIGMMTGIFLGRYIAGANLQKIFSILMLAMAIVTVSSTLMRS